MTSPEQLITHQPGSLEGSSQKNEQREPRLAITQISPDNEKEIAAYLQFEVTQGFSSDLQERLASAATPNDADRVLQNQVRYRQQQMRAGQLAVAIGRSGENIAATSVVVLQDGAMGKHVQPSEAYAAGTVTSKDMRSQGVGKKMAAEQERIARQAGKESIITVIQDSNTPSARLRMNVGYQLEGVDERADEVDYQYRKSLTAPEAEDRDWAQIITAEDFDTIGCDVESTAPDRVLIDPLDKDRVRAALQAGYKGVHALLVKDLSPQLIDRMQQDGMYFVFE